MKALYTLFVLFILLTSCQTSAQIFPVQVVTQLTPPYSPYLTDYTSPGSRRIMIHLRMNDITINDYEAKFRITIEGVGITIRTKQNLTLQPITIQGGIPNILYGEDLVEYFNPNNLDFSGFSRNEFAKTGKLPEGVYRFSVEVLDYNRNTVVSNKGTSVAWIILNDPPLLNLPRKETKIKTVDPTNIVFTWTPRHTGSPNSAFTTEYTFRLVEIWPINRSPNDAFLSQQPLYEITTAQTQIVYGLAEPALIPGRKYAWQVQAIDTDGRDLFKNQGKSEVFSFQFADELGIPQNFRKEGGNDVTISLRWEPAMNGEMADQYRIRYKPQSNTIWYESITKNLWITIPDLNPNAEYDFEIRAEKGKQHSYYSLMQRFSTDETKTDSDFKCGEPANIQPASSLAPLDALFPGDEFTASDFKIIVTEVISSKGGIFSGKGMMQVKMFNDASIEVKFSCGINGNYQLISGNVESTYEKGSKMGQVTEQMQKIGEEKKKPQAKKDSASLSSPIIVAGIIDSVYVNGEGKIVVVDEEGKETLFEQKKDEQTGGVMETVIADSGGNTFTVGKDGTVNSSGSTAISAVDSTVKYGVTFEADPSQQFGFDKGQYPQLDRHYQKETLNDKVYTIPWKAVGVGSFDKVKAIASVKRPDLLKEIGFHSPLGSLPKLPGSDSELQVTVQGHDHQGVEQVSVYLTKQDTTGKSKEETIGRLNVISYNKIYRTLVLVPVNNTKLASNVSQSQLQQELNKIFGQAAVEWQIQMSPSIKCNYDENGDGLEFGSSGLLSNYTPEMRKVINTFKDIYPILNDTYYLFLVPRASDRNATGYMPRKKQAGFVFTEQLGSADPIKTIAHELAHGAFRLEHTFPELPQNGNNLLDYSSTGTVLHKHQWDLIHDPVAVLGLFEGDEAGASKSLLTSKYVFTHDQLSTKAYATTKGQDEFTQQAIDEIDSKLYQLDTASLKTYIYFGYVWIHQGNINRFDQIIDNTFKHAYDSIREHLNVKDFNLLAIVNAKYDTALANGMKTVSFREKFYPLSGLPSSCTKAVNDYLGSSYKKTFVNDLDDALKERANILLQKLKDCEVVVPQEIVIHYKRKGRNQYRTWGEFTIVGTDYKGYILERPMGDSPTQLEDCKRHPAGTFDLVYSTNATGKESKFWNVTMCLKEHIAYKLHGGTRVDNSDGCFLINYSSPQFDKYPEAFQANEEDVCIRPAKKRRSNSDKNKYVIANTYFEHYDENNPAYKLKHYVETMEAEIKKKYEIEEVVKKIIIDEQNEKIDP